MKILFTKSDLLGSKLIRAVTEEPVSHCAILHGDQVTHSTFYGVVTESYEEFAAVNEVVHSVEVKNAPILIKGHKGSCYDFGAFIYLGLRLLFPLILPKKNLWQTTGMFLCTEFVTHVFTTYWFIGLYSRDADSGGS